MRLLVIDGNSIANRAFYGIKLLTTKDGRYTNAIYGFLNILLSLLKECQPDEVAVAFDLKAPTFRHKMYDGYKATRHAMPEELAQQMPVLKQLLADLGYRTVTAEGWEADDILGTLAAACAARKDDCFLATGDRDSLQLVSESTTVLLAATVMGRSKTVVMDEDAIQEKYGLAPKQLIEVKSLMGDTSDNIPGVKGIGEKTALSLVQTFGSLEGVYQNIDDKRIKPKQREHLLEDKPMAELSHTLGTIRTDAPIDTAEGSYTVGEGNKPAAVRLLQELEIHSLIPRFGLDGVAPEAAAEEQAVELPEADLASLPLTPAGHYLVAARPAVTGKQGTRNVVLQPESWYAVQDATVYPLEDADLVRLLDNADVTLDVFNAAPLYAKAMAANGWGSSIVWDGKLAAYLLDASASKYQISELIPAYKAAAAFSCTDYPDAGRLADLHPRPYSLAAGMCFTLCGLLALAAAPGFALILVSVGLIGCGSSVFHPESSRVAQLASGGRKGLAQSIFQVGGNAGSAMGPMLDALIVITNGQAKIGWFALAALLAIFILVKIGNWYKRQLALAARRPAVAADTTGPGLSKRKIRNALIILGVLVFSKYFYIASMTNYFTFFLMDKFSMSVQGAQYALFAFLAASAAGTFIGGPVGDRIGRKYVIWGSILGAAPFTLMLPYAGLTGTIVLAVIIGLVISSAFSAILVYATDLMPGKVGMIAGGVFGLMFGLGGLGSAFFGWLADRTSIEFIFRVSTLLPLLGIITGFLPNIELKRDEK